MCQRAVFVVVDGVDDGVVVDGIVFVDVDDVDDDVNDVVVCDVVDVCDQADWPTTDTHTGPSWR